MSRFLIAALALLALAPTLRAEPQNQEPGRSPAEQFQALVGQYETAQREYFQASTQAKTNEERAEAQKKRPDAGQYADRLLELAEKHSDDPVAVDALVWVVGQVRTAQQLDRALAALQENHLESDKLGAVCQRVVYVWSPRAEEFLRDVLANSPHENVKGLACLSLAKYLQQQSSLIDALKNRPEMASRLEQYYGKQYAGWIKSRDADQVVKETEALFERAARDFATLSYGRGTIGEAAQRELFEIRHLAVGCVAPEIEGEDIDGVQFKLSDYRGKVVMLDFWGNW